LAYVQSSMITAMGSPPSRSISKGRRPLGVVLIEPSRCPQLMGYLEQYPVEILGLADLDLGSPVAIQAKKKGVLVTQDYPKLLELSNLDLIINLSPDKTMEVVIEQLKPEGALLIQASDQACLTASVRELILNRELAEILNQLLDCMSGMRGVKEALGEVLKSILLICNAQAAGLWLRQGKDFVLFVGEGLPEGLRDYPSPHMGQGALGILLEEREVVTVKDLKAHIGFPDRDKFMSWDIAGLIMLPMLKEQEVTGALMIMSSRALSRELEDLLGLIEALVGLTAEVLEGTERASKTISCTRDELTGLHNESYLQDRLEDQIAHAWRRGVSFSIICIKPTPTNKLIASDRFPLLSSHLRKSATEILGSIRKMDVAARCKAGDIFLILPETGAPEAFEIARRILARLERTQPKEPAAQALRYVLGLASFPDHGTCSEELLERASRAAGRAASEGLSSVLATPRAGPGGFLAAPNQITKMYPPLGELFELLWELRGLQKDSWDHARGVAFYAGRIAQSLGLDERSVLNLQISGWLHDLGKMGIFFPKEKLPEQFPRLSQVDREIHAAMGAFILKSFVKNESILRGVFHHHDRFDGAGKPNGLRGEGIPLEGRILSVANAYQHLLTESGAFEGRQGVFSKLRDMAGNLLDPQLVESLIRSEGQALDLRQEEPPLPLGKKGKVTSSLFTIRLSDQSFGHKRGVTGEIQEKSKT
jgi:diguanylate cyclase (GGDEF)-like protein